MWQIEMRATPLNRTQLALGTHQILAPVHAQGVPRSAQQVVQVLLGILRCPGVVLGAVPALRRHLPACSHQAGGQDTSPRRIHCQ